jgi:hypothetical protein
MIQNHFTKAHLFVFLGIWLGFTALTYWIADHGIDDYDHRRLVTLTTLGTILGPMTGAISRNCQLLPRLLAQPAALLRGLPGRWNDSPAHQVAVQLGRVGTADGVVDCRPTRLVHGRDRVFRSRAELTAASTCPATLARWKGENHEVSSAPTGSP